MIKTFAASSSRAASLGPVPQPVTQPPNGANLEAIQELQRALQEREKSSSPTQALQGSLQTQEAIQFLRGDAFVNPEADVTKVDLNDPVAVAKLAKVLGYPFAPQQDKAVGSTSSRGAPGVTGKAAVQGADKLPDDAQFDGALVGADKTIKREDLGSKKDLPAVTLRDIQGFTPKDGRARTDDTIIQVNGINTTLQEQKKALQATADKTGAKVVGIHNATDGIPRDLAQSIGDKTGLGTNVAVDSLRDVILQELRAGRPVHLAAHSQGGLITSRALGQVAEQLKKEHKDPKLLATIKVETFGAAAGRYPNGPQYVHYVNRADPVSDLFGVAGHASFFANPGKDAYGRDAVVKYFDEPVGTVASHSFQDVYLKHRDDFGVTYSGPGLLLQGQGRNLDGIRLRLDD